MITPLSSNFKDIASKDPVQTDQSKFAIEKLDKKLASFFHRMLVLRLQSRDLRWQYVSMVRQGTKYS